jgi:hypothetical protein
LAVAGCLAGLCFMGQTCMAGVAAPRAAIAAPIGASPISAYHSSGARIWYPAKSYPLLSLPDGRQEVVRSVLNIAKPMRFGDFAWNEEQIPKGPVWVRVDLARQLMSVFRAGHEIGAAVILYGTDGKPTPTGSFPILEKDKDHYSRSYNDAPMPYMLRLTRDGVAIHGSDVQQGWATHGCIGIPLAFARLLFAAASKGDLVVILPARP